MARVKKSEVNKANIRLIEVELYNYKQTKRELEKIKNSASCASIFEIERRTNAIEYALKVFENQPEKLRFIEAKYFERHLTDAGVMQALSIEQATFYRWKKEVIQIIADRLGYLI